ncbi:MAG TPA: hypothetical protein VFB74_34825 [Kribbellaceae bacterium]|nr:hypothetical protein [Kribbellaceae bacterium]
MTTRENEPRHDLANEPDDRETREPLRAGPVDESLDDQADAMPADRRTDTYADTDADSRVDTTTADTGADSRVDTATADTTADTTADATADTTADEQAARDTVDERVTAGTARDGAGTGGPAGALSDDEPLIPGDTAMDYTARWEAIQQGFVDDPRSAVTDADTLVGEVLKKLASTFDDQHKGLESQWSDGEPSTEDLRSALRRYRDFFERLLRL